MTDTKMLVCSRCGHEILALTYERTGGYCRPCGDLTNPAVRPPSSWLGDWQARLVSKIRALGVVSPQAYFLARPCVPYARLARELGEDVLAGQVQLFHRHEVFNSDLRTGALDSLGRHLAGALPLGWGVGKYFRGSVGGALANWGVDWDLPQAKAVKQGFFASLPPERWPPETNSDPYLVNLFKEHWPE